MHYPGSGHGGYLVAATLFLFSRIRARYDPIRSDTPFLSCTRPFANTGNQTFSLWAQPCGVQATSNWPRSKPAKIPAGLFRGRRHFAGTAGTGYHRLLPPKAGNGATVKYALASSIRPPNCTETDKMGRGGVFTEFPVSLTAQRSPLC